MARRKAPAHLPEILGSELRRREERQSAAVPSAAMEPWHVFPDLVRDDDEDRLGLPPGTVLCIACGAWVRWGFEDRDVLNRDGTNHHETCEPRRNTMTTEVAVSGTAAINRPRANQPFVTVQAGPRNAHTDPQSGLRFYRWLDRDLPSVTSIRRMAGLPFGLHNWTIGQVVTAAVEHLPDHAKRLTAAIKSTDPVARASTEALIRAELRAAATAERDRAASLGTAVHDAAAAGRLVEDVDPELRPRLRQYLSWLETSGAELLAAEFQVFNLAVGYAGTVDLICRLRDGSVWIVDLKTGKGVYSDHALQLVGYAMAEFVGQDDIVDEPLTELLGQVSGIAVLHLGDEGWEFHRVRWDAETWTAFRGLLAFATWSQGHSAVASFVLGSREGAAA